MKCGLCTWNTKSTCPWSGKVMDENEIACTTDFQPKRNISMNEYDKTMLKEITDNYGIKVVLMELSALCSMKTSQLLDKKDLDGAEKTAYNALVLNNLAKDVL